MDGVDQALNPELHRQVRRRLAVIILQSLTWLHSYCVCCSPHGTTRHAAIPQKHTALRHNTSVCRKAVEEEVAVRIAPRAMHLLCSCPMEAASLITVPLCASCVCVCVCVCACVCVSLSQLGEIVADVDVWYWGHEHSLQFFLPYMGLRRGRLIGNGSVPTLLSQTVSVQHAHHDTDCGFCIHQDADTQCAHAKNMYAHVIVI